MWQGQVSKVEMSYKIWVTGCKLVFGIVCLHNV